MLKTLIKLAYKFWPSLYKKRYYKTLKSLQSKKYKCEPELLYLKQVLKKDSVFIDIGTNKGIYLYQAEKIIKTGKIYGFEPNINLVNYIQPLFPKIQIIPAAVSSTSGTAILNIPKNGEKLQDTRASLESLEGNVEKLEIQMVKLDDWVQENNLKSIDLIKIDVEGHEFNTIKGCESILKEMKPVLIVEIELRHAQYPLKQIFDYIESFGYETFYFDRIKTALEPFDFQNINSFQKEDNANDFNNYINNFIFKPIR